MPYINKKARKELLIRFPENAGELNYWITCALKAHLGDNPDDDAFNSVIGVLECCKIELYARMIRPYEDKKIKENGDVY